MMLEKPSPEQHGDVFVPESTLEVESKQKILSILTEDIADLKAYKQEAQAMVDRAREAGDVRRADEAREAMREADEILKANEEELANLSLKVESSLN